MCRTGGNTSTDGSTPTWAFFVHIPLTMLKGYGGCLPLFCIIFFSHFLSFFPKDPDILNGVYMSEALNPIFVDNFERDPTLTWQYFGSSTGFFRLYPGKRAASNLAPSAPSRTGAELCQSPNWEAWASSSVAWCGLVAPPSDG